MSESEPSKVFTFDDRDPEMEAAVERARTTFRYFWRELVCERRRIVPALDLAVVKAPFSDGEDAPRAPDQPEVEQMWLGNIDFDGQFVIGSVLNAPNWLKSVSQGDSARLEVGQITDWMYVVDGEVYGAFTVNRMRAGMSEAERANHDGAWGLNFGDPASIRLVPRMQNWFSTENAELDEHPMSFSLATLLESELAKNPSMLTETDDRGWTILHHEALAGSLPTVELLLKAGADPNAKASNGATPLGLARVLGWDKVIARLAAAGASE